MKKYFLGMFFLLCSVDLFACSCGDGDFDFMVKNSEYVFVGKVGKKNIFLSFLNNRYKFNDVDFYKGSNLQDFVVWSPKFDASCGVDFRKDVRYIVFLSKYKNKLWADRCSSWSLTEANKNVINKFNHYFLSGVEIGQQQK